jgi:hypothetical protein
MQTGRGDTFVKRCSNMLTIGRMAKATGEALRAMRDALAGFIAKCEAGEGRSLLVDEYTVDDALQEIPETVRWPEPVSFRNAARKGRLVHPDPSTRSMDVTKS